MLSTSRWRGGTERRSPQREKFCYFDTLPNLHFIIARSTRGSRAATALNGQEANFIEQTTGASARIQMIGESGSEMSKYTAPSRYLREGALYMKQRGIVTTFALAAGSCRAVCKHRSDQPKLHKTRDAEHGDCKFVHR